MKNNPSLVKQRFINIETIEVFDILDNKTLSENELLKISRFILDEGSCNQKLIISNLINKIPTYSKNYDWNVASILQHIPAELVNVDGYHLEY